jgi:hypothetical protein
MEMSWMETFQLLGLDVLAVMLVIFVVLDLVEHAVHSARAAARSRCPRGTNAVARPQPRVSGVKHA